VRVGADSVTRPAGKPHGLTRARTSFIGRSDAVAKVARLLDSYRLVTVTGPGGVGKTRLADAVLRQVAGRFADGVAVVELAAVSEPALVSATVAAALDVRQAAGMSVVEALADRLSRQQLLLVLDNCEHVLDAAAELCEACWCPPTTSRSWPPAVSRSGWLTKLASGCLHSRFPARTCRSARTR
jgi:Cdc6-like AAA superfamily ATPase